MSMMMQKRALAGSSKAAAAAPVRGQRLVARAQTLSAGDLSAFKIVDLVEIASKKGVSGGRNATRDTLTNALLRVGVSVNDLTKGQLAELKVASPNGSSSFGSSSGSRFSGYSSSSPARGAAAGSGASLSASDLSAFKIVDLVEIASKKGVSGGRNATRDTLTNALLRVGVSVNDLTKGQRAELKVASPNGSSFDSSSSSGGGDRFSSYSSSSPARGAAAGSGSGSGAKLGAGDLSHLRIDDLRDLVKKTGAELPREPTKDGVISALVAKGVSLDHLTRGMLVDLSTKLGAPLAKDAESLKRNLSSLVGSGSSSYSSSSSSSSWRSTPAPAAAAPAGDRWAKYSAGQTSAASWRRSGSHNASGSKLGAGDLSQLRIDDLRDLVKKTGAQLPREPTKDGVISALVAKGVSLNDLTRGMLVDLANKKAVPLARDVDGLRKNLASAVGGSSSYSPSAPSSWRSTPAPAAPSSSNGASGDRWANYSRSSSNGASSYGSAAGGSVSERELSVFKTDVLSDLARKVGISMRNATKESIISQLARVLKRSDLSKGQLKELEAGALVGAGSRW